MLHVVDFFLIYDVRSWGLTLEGKQAEGSGDGRLLLDSVWQVQETQASLPLREPSKIKGEGATAAQLALLSCAAASSTKWGFDQTHGRLSGTDHSALAASGACVSDPQPLWFLSL